ncbi:MAG: hypothetical protein Q9165_008826 [Trypethelium subeluteriae]
MHPNTDDLFVAADYLVRHQVNSGFSFGVFDLEYKFRNPKSEATEGALYWETTDLEATPEKLLEQMDFPLCSVALSYDGHHPLEMAQMLPAIQKLPLFGTLYHALEELDPRPADSWKATAEKQVLMRNATSTRKDYEGQGLMKKQAQWLMREADRTGYRGIQIECVHDAVSGTWLNSPKPYKSTLVCKFDTETYEQKDEESGEMKKVFSPTQESTRDQAPDDGDPKVVFDEDGAEGRIGNDDGNGVEEDQHYHRANEYALSEVPTVRMPVECAISIVADHTFTALGGLLETEPPEMLGCVWTVFCAEGLQEDASLAANFSRGAMGKGAVKVHLDFFLVIVGQRGVPDFQNAGGCLAPGFAEHDPLLLALLSKKVHDGQATMSSIFGIFHLQTLDFVLGRLVFSDMSTLAANSIFSGWKANAPSLFSNRLATRISSAYR